jgi:CRP-like cAMP-binding protein
MFLTYQNNLPKITPNLADECTLHFYERGQEISVVNQGIWQVYRGIIQLSTFHESGEEVLLGWAKPASIFGQSLYNLPTYQAIALSDVYLRWYSMGEIENSPQLAARLFSQVTQVLHQKEALLAIAGLRRVEDRLQCLLELLKQEIGQPVEGGSRINARLTHQMLANAIGSTRVTITRLLGDFQRQGYLKMDGDRHLVILKKN